MDKARQRLERDIADIASRRRQVAFSEIERTVNRLASFHDVGRRQATHGVLFTVGTQRFMVSAHNPGDSHVKKYCVDDFLRAMNELGWYTED